MQTRGDHADPHQSRQWDGQGREKYPVNLISRKGRGNCLRHLLILLAQQLRDHSGPHIKQTKWLDPISSRQSDRQQGIAGHTWIYLNLFELFIFIPNDYICTLHSSWWPRRSCNSLSHEPCWVKPNCSTCPYPAPFLFKLPLRSKIGTYLLSRLLRISPKSSALKKTSCIFWQLDAKIENDHSNESLQLGSMWHFVSDSQLQICAWCDRMGDPGVISPKRHPLSMLALAAWLLNNKVAWPG